MKHIAGSWLGLLTMAAAAAEPSAPVALPGGGGGRLEMSESLRREARAALDRGVQWLSSQQNADGHWSNGGFPALTGLPLWALARSGRMDTEPARKAVRFLLSCVHEDGAIYVEPREKMKGGGMPNYNTAICMVALHLSGDPALVPTVQKARAYVARSQHLGGDVYHGGMGYDSSTGRAYADLSNSYIAYEAMRMTASAEDLRKAGEPKADLDWKAAQKFVQRTQNDARVNDQPWATDDPSDRGGFAYHPEQTRAGTVTNAQGVVKFRSMKGMTYAGLLSYIYAEVERSDPRVEATIDWVVGHWGLGASPAAPAAETPEDREGMFYLYNVMAKGLAAYGTDVFRPKGREAFNWRVDLIEKLIALQKTDPKTGGGYWVNDVGRYWESDPVLCTSYALVALEIALGGS